jgi:hypothetical protein
MIESPVLDLLIEHALKKERAKAESLIKQERIRTIIDVLEARFGLVSPEMLTYIRAVRDTTLIDTLVRLAATCPDLAAFSAGLPPSS